MTDLPRLGRRDLVAAGLAGAGLALMPRVARAAAPKQAAQVPGVQRLAVGDMEVTALSDGYIDIDPSLFPNATPEAVAALKNAAFLAPDAPLRSGVNTYVVNTGDRLVLIDSGCADLLGPTMGRLPANLVAAGIDPATIDTIVLTHMHPDHIGGIASAEGAAAFPEAELVVHEADWAFWTSADMTARAPDAVKPFFLAAQKNAAAYDGRVRRLDSDGEIVPGLSLMHLPGHTPGHAGIVVADGADSLLVWGDIVHAAPLQFARPDWAIAFDVDPEGAVETRGRVFDMVARDRLRVAGMHIPFPGIGHVERAAEGYRFTPENWEYRL